MPVIVFASSKGGCGKTSLCVSVASELSRIGEDSGVSITIVDGDNHKHSATWAKREGCPSNVHYIESRREGKEDHDILDDISKAQEQSQFVLVDLQGSANFAMSLAVSQADYVIIPCQGSDNDALEALRTLKMIKAQEKILGRPINYAIAMTRIHPAVTPRSLKNVLDQLLDSGVNILENFFYERDAIKAMFSFGVPLHKINKKDAYQLEKAVNNVGDIVTEVLSNIKNARVGEG